jgi:hypothetical protein
LTAQPGTAFDAEVVQVQAASAAAAADARLQTQVMLRLGDAIVAATLPGPPPQVGSKLPLIYLGQQNGQPQFLLAPSSGRTAVQTQLSGLGQLLSALQQMQTPQTAATALAEGQPQSAATAPEPVWPRPLQSTAQAAQLLAKALVSSGLFYESQLGAWAQGQQPLSALLVQPQGRLSPLLQQNAQPAADPAAQKAPATPAPGQQPTTPTSPAAQGTTSEPAPVAPRHAALAAYGAVQSAPQATSDPAQLVARLPAELHGIVQQQLQALMQGQVVWEGLLWPGQTLRWSLRPEPEGSAPQHGAPLARSWSTQLTLDLPNLGTVQARLRLSANRVDLLLQRGDQAQQRIDSALPDLQAALQQAGLEVGVVQLAPLPAEPAQ